MALPLLTFLIAIPLVAAAIIAVATKNTKQGETEARWLAMLASVLALGLSLVLLAQFEPEQAGFQFNEYRPWFSEYNIAYHLGVDGISLSMILLTTILMPLCILCSWESVKKRVREYMIAFLLLEAMVIGSFAALDLLVFYLFFEAVLIPMYLIIGIWGGDRRIYAAYKFFLYTLAGSVLFLIALLYLYFAFGTTDIPTLMQEASGLELSVQRWLWLAMFASFAVKVPMWPFHTWLPDAHVQAPTAGSVILAGVLLKLGAYGFLRFSLPMLPAASHEFADAVFVLSIIAVGYTSLVALVQEDMKKLIAYSSVAHMGYVTLGIFSFTQQGLEGAIFQMISHGIVSAALFLCVGVLYDRMHTKEIAQYGGVVNVMPQFAFVFMVFTMASAGLPATSGFVGEILVLVGTFQVAQWAAVGAATGLVLGAAYMLWLYRRVMFGMPANHEVTQLQDLSSREWVVFLPLLFGALWLGVMPKPTLRLINAPVLGILAQTGSVSATAAESAAHGEDNENQNADDGELEQEGNHPTDEQERDESAEHEQNDTGIPVHNANDTPDKEGLEGEE
jgi:NADH-quinone oxidoreductase subunit M